MNKDQNHDVHKLDSQRNEGIQVDLMGTTSAAKTVNLHYFHAAPTDIKSQRLLPYFKESTSS